MEQQALFEFENKYSDLNPNDVVFTPKPVAEFIVNWADPKGKCLDPCMGQGVFYDLLPDPKDWCEVTKGKNFFDYTDKVDWVISNPPYSDFNRFLGHSFELADNVVYLVPVAKIWKSWGTIMQIKEYGGIVKAWMIPSNRCGFPFGFPAMAVHFKRGYTGMTEISYAPK